MGYFLLVKMFMKLFIALKENFARWKFTIRSYLPTYLILLACSYMCILMHYTFVSQEASHEISKIYTSWKYPILRYLVAIAMFMYVHSYMHRKIDIEFVCFCIHVHVDSWNLQEKTPKICWQTSLYLSIHRTWNKDLLCTTLLANTYHTNMGNFYYKRWQRWYFQLPLKKLCWLHGRRNSKRSWLSGTKAKGWGWVQSFGRNILPYIVFIREFFISAFCDTVPDNKAKTTTSCTKVSSGILVRISYSTVY